MLDRYFSTNHFSRVYAENEQEMNNMLEERTKVTNQLMDYEILYELTLPGKIMTSHAVVQNEGTLTWKINLFKFLADDYVLSAESRAVNIWAFAVTLLLIVFSGYCFKISFCSYGNKAAFPCVRNTADDNLRLSKKRMPGAAG